MLRQLRQTLTVRRIIQLAIAASALIAIGFVSVSLSSAQSNELGFGYGNGVQLVDPDGRNEVPFWVHRQTATVDFKLYGLSASQFIEHYRTYNPWQSPIIDVNGLPTVTTWQQSFSSGNSWEIRPVRLPTATVPSGIYVIEASLSGAAPKGTPVRSLIAVGRNALILKRGSGGQITAWATRLQSGAPVNGMTITLYDAQGAVLTQGVTNADGIATLTMGSGEPLMAVGQVGDETTIAGLDWQWRNYGDGSWSTPTNNAYTIYLHTERPLYRPGDTVHYNAIVRNKLTSGYTPVAPGQPISITLRDARSNVVATVIKNADEFGALAGEFLLGDEPPLGDYSLELSIGGQVQSQRLRVEEYRKPEYEVKVNTPAAFAIAGDAIPVSVKADYFFGQPVANATVKLQIYRQPYYWYDYWWWYGHQGPPNYGGLVVELNGVTDADGRWTTTFTPDAIDQYNAAYTFKATVTDARNLPITAESGVTVYWNDFKLAVRSDRYGYRSDEAVTVHLDARGHDEAPVAGQTITIRIVRDDWQTGNTSDAVPPQTITTDATGKAVVTYATLPQGWYRIIARSVDGRGRAVEAYSYLWVYDEGGDSWWYWNNDDISITTDRESYAPGDTATLLIQSRIQGIALLTVERAGVHKEVIVPLNGPMTTVQLPITADFAPNVFAKIHIFKKAGAGEQNAEGRFVSTQTEVRVPAIDKRLTVEIMPNTTTYRPGENATLTLRVADASGQPVRARVSLAVVDEAIFALQADFSADLFEAFHGAQPNSVLTYDTLARRPYYYAFEGPIADNDGMPTAAPTPEAGTPATSTAVPRRLFLDTAYWNPALLTDSDGRASVTITLPDNLTTWRVIARAVTVETQVGEAKTKVLVTQEIIARPALPSFAVLGDRFAVGLVAQNFSGADTSGAVEMVSNHLMLLNPGAQTVNLPNRGTAVAHWTAVAAKIGTGLVTSTVSSGAGADTVELPLQTKAFAAPDRWSASGQANLTTTETFTVPFNAVNEDSEFTLRLSSSIALGLLDGLDELIDYPYGCVEQTMSRVLPSAVAAKTYADLGIPNPKAGDLPDIISQGVQKLYGFQHQSGSWGWFYDDDGGAYMTAYVLFGLTTIQQAGYDVDSGVLNRGFGYLDSVLGGVDEPTTKAFALYVKALAGRAQGAPDLPLAQALIGQADGMDAAALSALALALHLGGDTTSAQSVIDKLISRVQETPTWASWPQNHDDWQWYHWQTMSSTEKNTAFALRALLALRADHPLLPKTVRWLMAHRNGAGWGGYGSANTQATAFAVLGLSDYVQQFNELAADYTYTVALNGQPIASGEVTPATARQPIAPIDVPGSALRTGVNEVRIERSGGPGQLYYTAALHQQLFYDSFSPVTSLEQGLALARSYRLVEGAPRSDGAYNLGDVVEVTLQLKASERISYVLVEDPLPAGFEGIRERVNAVGWGHCDFCPVAEPFFWQEWGYNRKDVRDDRVEFFITDLWPGEHTFTYLMRATTAGEFSVLPGQAYPMYNESIWGRSASQQVRVAPETLVARPALAGDFDHDCQVSPFDARLVAGVYGATNPQRNLVGDALITLGDVSAVAARRGATCLSDQSLPGQGNGLVQFELTSAASQLQVGEEMTVDVILRNASSIDPTHLDGLGLTLHFNPHMMAVTGVDWNGALGNAAPLGPSIDNAQGVLAFGLIDLPTGLPLNSPLVTLTFAGRGVGSATIAVKEAEAVDSAGRLITASAQSGGVIVIDGDQLFLPVVDR